MAKINRREFVAGIATAGAGVCLCQVAACTRSKTPPIQPGAYIIERGKVTINLPQVPELANIGGAIKIPDPKLPEPIIIARVTDNQFAVLALKCTHAGEEIEYLAEQQHFQCSKCDHSLFDMNGNPLKGPAKTPLNKYLSRVAILNRDKLIVYMRM